MEIWDQTLEQGHLGKRKVTRLAIVAHQDDVEILAYSGIEACYRDEKEGFAAIVVTSGVDSPRKGKYKDVTGEQMGEIRREEQIRAAELGDYQELVMMGYESSTVRNNEDHTLVRELRELVLRHRPRIIYTHNPADKHDTHVAVTMRVLEALGSIREEYRPEKVYGCEVWRGLDWALEEDKVLLDTSGKPELAVELIRVFESQVDGGKRYDLAEIGRRHANATFSSAYDVDAVESGNFAIDMTGWIGEDGSYAVRAMDEIVERLKVDVVRRLKKYSR